MFMVRQGATADMRPIGVIGLRAVRAAPIYEAARKIKLTDLIRRSFKDVMPSWTAQDPIVRRWKVRNLRYVARGFKDIVVLHSTMRTWKIKAVVGVGELRFIQYCADGRILDYGVTSLQYVTDNGVAGIVDTIDGTIAQSLFKHHGLGLGTNAENQTDSALQTELTTQYDPDNLRAVGTLSQPAANQSRSVATNLVDAIVAITEHGVFSQAAVGGGVLLDRSVFSAVNLVAADSLQSTYTLTLVAGG